MKLLLVLLVAIAAAPVMASSTAASAPYAGQQTREIKALSAAEQADLLAGRGMGLAKAAELNGYPGPAHVLELAEPLALSAEQRQRTQALFDAMAARASSLGQSLIDAERELDRLFANREAEAGRVDAALARIGALQAQVRAAHLQAHIEQAGILEREQIHKYNALRGYDAAGGPHGDHGSKRHH
jgi:hypothetical protein